MVILLFASLFELSEMIAVLVEADEDDEISRLFWDILMQIHQFFAYKNS